MSDTTTWRVTIPIIGEILLIVDAASKDDAIELAHEMAETEDITSWTTVYEHCKAVPCE